nr:MAG TPA: hypothetical protein [Caudoviricetes sp.]
MQRLWVGCWCKDKTGFSNMQEHLTKKLQIEQHLPLRTRF